MHSDTQARPYLHVHYRACPLRPSEDQIVAIEKFFGMSRMVTNHLLQLTKDYPEELARSKQFTMNELEREVLKYMNESEHPLFKEGLLTPGILKGILVAWLSEWEDFRARRTMRPIFTKNSDEQTFYIIDNAAVEYTDNKFKMVHCPDLTLHLKSSIYPVSYKAPVHLLKRTLDGAYWLYTLHEYTRYQPAQSTDEVLAVWCDKIITLERESKTTRRRYLATSGSRNREKIQENEYHLMTLRKITLDRLLRIRETRIQDHISRTVSIAA